MLLGLLASSALASTPRLPKLPERTGDLVACPTQEALSRRFSTQSDMNGGGFGYYSAAYDDNRQPSIVNPSRQGVEDYVNDQAAGHVPDADEKLTFLWGLACAYPELDYVQTAFQTVRGAWLADTGVSPETEAAWHSLEADHARSDPQQAASCPNGDAWHTEDPAHLARQYALCGGMNPAKATANLLDGLDVATPAVNEWVIAAGVVIQCAGGMPQSGDGRSTNGAYWDWKTCEDVAARYSHAALDTQLKNEGVSDYVRLDYEVKAEESKAKLDKLSTGFATFEKGWPATKHLYDATVAQVSARYVPMLAKWGPTLDDVDVWVEQLRGGPGFADGCADKFGGEMQSYLKDSVANGAALGKGDALWQVLREPVGVGLLEAYALCRGQTGFPGYGDMVAKDALAGVERVTRWHRGFDDALRAENRTDGMFVAGAGSAGERLPPEAQQARLSFAFEPDAARTWLRVSDKAPDKPYSYEETVAGISTVGDVTTVSFPKRSGTESVPTNCSADYSHIARIDEFGKFWYDWKCLGSMNVTVNDTYRPVQIPAWQAGKVAVGTKVAVELEGQGTEYRIEEGGPTPVKADLVWVKKGADIVWAAGFGVP